MRIDHYAYQRATRVAGIGLFLQAGIGLLLLFFGSVGKDSSSWLAAFFALPGVLAWLGLIIVFYQHKLERLEALEEDELAASRTKAESFFDRAADETRVAARRLALMHKWLMPALSLFIALVLAGLAWGMLRYLGHASADPTEFHRTDQKGWAIGIFLFLAGVAFIFSRYIAGMAKQQAWQNLRGGAAYLVGTALVLLAVAGGIIFRFFENEHVIEYVAYAIPVFMLLIAAEITLNLILNLYRPRIPGEVPRPAFDSKILSLLATPDSIVRSLNEAVNYQFGFDVTSSWGYQLLLRSFVSLVVLGVAAMVAMSTMVIVEPHQQAVKLRCGKIVGDTVYKSGIMWKWPWPFETADIYDVSRVRSLHLTAKVIDQEKLNDDQKVFLWSNTDPPKTEGTLDPFIVGSPVVSTQPERSVPGLLEASVSESAAEAAPSDQAEAKRLNEVSDFYSLVDAEIVLQYRIRQDHDQLLEFLRFGTETVARRQTLTDRERALKVLALAEVSRRLSRMSLDEVLAPGRTDLADGLQRDIQASLDKHQTGLEVVAVTLPMLRPSGSAAPSFEELSISTQAARQRIAQVRRNVFIQFTSNLGSAALADQMIQEIDEYERLLALHGSDSPEVIVQRQKAVDLLVKGGGRAAQDIAEAEKDRWVTLMDNRAQADRVQSQVFAYRASPELYRQRETMKVFKRLLPRIDKFIVAIDPSRVNVNADLKKINPILEFAGASEEEKNRK